MAPKKGHNSRDPERDKKFAGMMDHVRKLLAIDAKIQPLLDERKKARALAKSDGHKLSAINAMVRVAQMDDQQIFVDELKELVLIAEGFNLLPPGGQGDLFPERRDKKEKSYDDGYAAGLRGDNAQPPQGFDPTEWMDGWHAGQKVAADKLQSDMEKRNAAKAPAADSTGGDPFPDPDPKPETTDSEWNAAAPDNASKH